MTTGEKESLFQCESIRTASDDAQIDSVVKQARDYYPSVRAASEGMELQVCAGKQLVAIEQFAVGR